MHIKTKYSQGFKILLPLFLFIMIFSPSCRKETNNDPNQETSLKDFKLPAIQANQ
jgi:hypothetical protein